MDEIRKHLDAISVAHRTPGTERIIDTSVAALTTLAEQHDIRHDTMLAAIITARANRPQDARQLLDNGHP